MQFTLILIHPRRMYFLKKQTSMKKRMKDQKTRWRHPCQPQAALWPGRAQLPPSSRSAPTMKPGGVTSSALPSEPWLQACHGYRLGQRLCGMLPGSCGFTGWEPPARQPHESWQLPGGQTQIALAGDQVLLWQRFQTFHISLYGLRKFKWKGSPNWGECVCACVECVNFSQ